MSQFKSIDHGTMREMNLALILNSLRLHSPISRAGLSHITGLNKATITSLVRELLKRDLIREIGIDATSSEVGRPAINLELNPGAGYIIGAEIGVDFISVIVTNFAADVLVRRYENMAHLDTQDAIYARLLQMLKVCQEEISRNGRPVFGIGLGVPGLVDGTNGMLLFAPNLGWRNVPVREMLEAEFNIPVFVDNEANMAALGETYFGAAQEGEYVLYVSAAVGLGGGIVFGGQLMGGISGFAGEVGHMTIDPDGLPCNCGNRGCWETLVSQRALYRYVEEAILSGKTSSLSAATSGQFARLTVPMIVQAAQQKDAVARQALERMATWLGIGVAGLVNVLNPDRVVLGGILSLCQEFVRPIVEKIVTERALQWPGRACVLTFSENGTDACVLGGVATVYRKVLTQPTGWRSL